MIFFNLFDQRFILFQTISWFDQVKKSIWICEFSKTFHTFCYGNYTHSPCINNSLFFFPEKAFFDPSLLELLYFPEDQKYVYRVLHFKNCFTFALSPRLSLRFCTTCVWDQKCLKKTLYTGYLGFIYWKYCIKGDNVIFTMCHFCPLHMQTISPQL